MTKIKFIFDQKKNNSSKIEDEEKKMMAKKKIVIKRSGVRMRASSFYIPKDEPSKPLGEDSNFVSLDQQTVGVADGVGGWAKRGIDSGKIARALMLNSFQAANNDKIQEDPKKILEEAFERSTEDMKLGGASTACIVRVSQDGLLSSANVGDSGFIVFRANKVVFRSKPQQRRFNCPYQLGATRLKPDVAAEEHFCVSAGDIVVVATDGLLDNMFESDIEAVIAAHVDSNPDEIARSLALEAWSKSRDPEFDSPFAIEARNNEKSHPGGKVDDITVVVGKIVPNYHMHLRT